MSAIDWEDTAGLSGNSGKSNIDFDMLFLRPRAPENVGGENAYQVKILQKPCPYMVHWPNKTQDKERTDAPFFDAEFSNKKSRNCHKAFVRDKVSGKLVLDNETECPWCKKGYNKQLKYMVNVYDRDAKAVRILDIPGIILDGIGNKIRVAKEREDILNIGGFSDSVFNVIAAFASGKLNGQHWVSEIDKTPL